MSILKNLPFTFWIEKGRFGFAARGLYVNFLPLIDKLLSVHSGPLGRNETGRGAASHTQPPALKRAGNNPLDFFAGKSEAEIQKYIALCKQAETFQKDK